MLIFFSSFCSSFMASWFNWSLGKKSSISFIYGWYICICQSFESKDCKTWTCFPCSSMVFRISNVVPTVDKWILLAPLSYAVVRAIILHLSGSDIYLFTWWKCRYLCCCSLNVILQFFISNFFINCHDYSLCFFQ